MALHNLVEGFVGAENGLLIGSGLLANVFGCLDFWDWETGVGPVYGCEERSGIAVVHLAVHNEAARL
jgi:hypothetical protein